MVARVRRLELLSMVSTAQRRRHRYEYRRRRGGGGGGGGVQVFLLCLCYPFRVKETQTMLWYPPVRERTTQETESKNVRKMVRRPWNLYPASSVWGACATVQFFGLNDQSRPCHVLGQRRLAPQAPFEKNPGRCLFEIGTAISSETGRRVSDLGSVRRVSTSPWHSVARTRM